MIDLYYWICTATFFVQSTVLLRLSYADTGLGMFLVFFVTSIPYIGCAYVDVESSRGDERLLF